MSRDDERSTGALLILKLFQIKYEQEKCQSSLPYQAILQMKELGSPCEKKIFFRLNELVGHRGNK